jgi:hypothetical protein
MIEEAESRDGWKPSPPMLNGDKPALRAIARQIVPAVQHRIAVLSSMSM